MKAFRHIEARCDFSVRAGAISLLMLLVSLRAFAGDQVRDCTEVPWAGQPVEFCAQVDDATTLAVNWRKQDVGKAYDSLEMTPSICAGRRCFRVMLPSASVGTSTVEYFFSGTGGANGHSIGGEESWQVTARTGAPPLDLGVPLAASARDASPNHLEPVTTFRARNHVASLSVFGTSVVAAGFGVAFGLQAKSAGDSVAASSGSAASSTSDARTAATRANYCWAAAAVLAATSGVLFMLHH